MISGTMKWLSADRGFGLITRDDGDTDVFVHFSAIAGSGAQGIENNQRVEFDIAQSRREIHAVNIRPIRP
ncbi:cold-shock protein [Actinoplanes lobatus]|uniref:Cold-shock protein n=1 Tax=Actinoplanes lobatus TaxID=113568 RepID=A0A7W7MLR8_9ACTN|nr:cold-shock protein [Actinoplanes lobatus]MBB4755162.1 CspA family cold shock protein [Actinoplanes lobatus]GGN96366.1 cold-shock protein [Actinoplanes lobatus]GIE45406.1 cold-shock protein [Actinoplanes lobatus]